MEEDKEFITTFEQLGVKTNKLSEMTKVDLFKILNRVDDENMAAGLLIAASAEVCRRLLVERDREHSGIYIAPEI